jgi:hypothetical protein
LEGVEKEVEGLLASSSSKEAMMWEGCWRNICHVQ